MPVANITDYSFLEPFMDYNENNLYNCREKLMVNTELYKLLSDFKISEKRFDYNNLKYTITQIKKKTIQFINNITQKKINFTMFCDSFKSNKQLFSFKKINDHMTDIHYLIQDYNMFLCEKYDIIKKCNLESTLINEIYKSFNFKRFKNNKIKEMNILFNFSSINNSDCIDNTYTIILTRYYRNHLNNTETRAIGKIISNIEMLFMKIIMVLDNIGIIGGIKVINI